MRFFSGELDGKKARDLANIMDNSVDKYEDRLKIINDALEGTTFFEEYFDEMFPKELNQDDFLSQDDNICMMLENYGSYLINSRDIKEDETTPYKIYYDEYSFQRALRKSVSVDTLDSIPFFVNKDSNYKVAKDQKITKEDLKRDDILGGVLRDYQNYLDLIEMQSNKLKGKNRIKGEIQRDMIICKDQLLGVFGYQLDNMSESSDPDYSKIDFSNFTHLKGRSVSFNDKEPIWVDGLLRISYNGDLQNDFQCILYDLEKLIEKTPLTKREKQALKLYRKGYEGVEIAKRLKISDSRVYQLIDNAIHRIANKAKDLKFSCWHGSGVNVIINK